jgi:hypothetical protein
MRSPSSENTPISCPGKVRPHDTSSSGWLVTAARTGSATPSS